MRWQIRPNENTARQLLILYLKLDKPKQALTYAQYLISKGAKPNFIPMEDVINKLIDNKNRLEKDSENMEIKLQIAQLYNSIGNLDVAKWYESAK